MMCRARRQQSRFIILCKCCFGSFLQSLLGDTSNKLSLQGTQVHGARMENGHRMGPTLAHEPQGNPDEGSKEEQGLRRRNSFTQAGGLWRAGRPWARTFGVMILHAFVLTACSQYVV